MARLSLLFGFLMVALGLVAWGLSETHAKTALIPSFFGAALMLCGVIGAKFPAANKHVMHVAALVSLLGAGGGLAMASKALAAGGQLNWLKISSQGILGVLCLVFLVLCVRSFIRARQARKLA